MAPIRLVYLLVALAVLWASYWVVGSWRLEARIEGWRDDRIAEGWQAEWTDLKIAGFPNRFDRTLTNPIIADPNTGWAWSAPFFQILGLTYRPNEVVLIWPDTQQVQTPWQRITVTGAELQGSLKLLPGNARELETATLVFKDLEMSSDAGWTMAANEMRLATRATANQPEAKDIGFEVRGLKPPAPVIAALSDADLVPERLDRLRADLAVVFDAPWDNRALNDSRPQPKEITIREIALQWGGLELRIAGQVTADRDGRAQGKVLVKATNWREILSLAEGSGVVPQPLAGAIEGGLELLSGLAGSGKTLDIPVTFERGRTKIGPLAIAKAPELRLP